MTINHAIGNIKNYKKKYGIGKAIRAIAHYAYVGIKKNSIDYSKEDILDVNGYKIGVMPNDPFGTSSELRIFRSHEPLTTKLISEFLQDGMICLDIGSNIGYYALLESKLVGEKGKIIAIEPSPDNVKYLKRNLDLQNITNVEVSNFAAGEKDGTLKFLIYEDAANSCMVIPEGQESKFPGTVIEVPVKRIDSFIEDYDLDKIDLLRMDTEGYEFNIFQGMRETIRKYHPIIQLEVHRSIMGQENTRNFLEGLRDDGYDVKNYVPRDLDVPIIGTMDDVKNIDMNTLLKMLEAKKLPSFFMLTLI
ncbi:FkbM family methyltransferase [Nitrosopumilus sp.]|uniref:FkbM family methyltransferase n=1 Tax=Nitrosopumilus sp. TaxID=2024843 RepID=UPI002616AECE|nr:FkbM family methyltransferase [Nitrosopumilus sp.]